MNKQELEKQAEALYTDVRSFLDNTFELIDQIEKPQKAVVPKLVAEWLKENRHAHTLLKVLNAAENERIVPYAVNDWILDNQRDFVVAWLDGYEVEKEKLYVVTDGNKLYLKKFEELNAVIIIDDVVGATDYAQHFVDKIKAQKAADELGWSVKEVE